MAVESRAVATATRAPVVPRAPTAEVMVQVEGVSKTFGDSAAVDDASFSLERGRFLTILGPSGSGKTTLLRMIAGFLAPTTGEIYVAGRPVSQVPAHKRSIGMVFQRLALFPHMSVADNVAYPLKMRRFDPRTIPERVERYLGLVRLAGYGKRRIHELSGGQQQRVAVARALAMDPAMLLLDEPFGALDALTRATLQDELGRLCQATGKTVLLITNDVDEALILADRIIPLDPGPRATLGPSFEVSVPRPRERRAMNQDERYKELRRAVTQYLIDAGMRRASVAASKVIQLPALRPRASGERDGDLATLLRMRHAARLAHLEREAAGAPANQPVTVIA